MIAQCEECVRTRRAHWQDVQYGAGRRVFGVPLERGSGQVRRCTVCAAEKDFAAVYQEGRGEGRLKKVKGKKPSGKNPAKKGDRKS